MTKIDIFSGFLGAGKTTLIKKLIKEAYCSEKVVLIENEFGEIGIDGGFLQDAGIEIKEMNSGCICCSLVGDFSEALLKVLTEYTPDRVIIEPSGVGKLSDVIRAVQGVDYSDCALNCFTTVVDVNKCKMYMKNFGEFFNDQVTHASAIVLSHTGGAKDHRIEETVSLLRTHNPDAVIVTTPWDQLSGADVLRAMERKDTLEDALKRLTEDVEHHHHHHHHDHEEEHEEHCSCHHHDHEDEHGEHCSCHHHDHEDEHDEHCSCHHHDHEDEHEEHCSCHHHDHEDEHEEHCSCHHHDHEDEHDEHCSCHHHDHEDEHDEHCSCHHHDHEDEHDEHHHHEHGEHCSCGCGGHHHHHHHADEVFSSFGAETTKRFTVEGITSILESFSESDEYGMILRAKGIVMGEGAEWIHFDYVPGEPDVRYGTAATIGRLCVIGSGIDEGRIKELFGL